MSWRRLPDAQLADQRVDAIAGALYDRLDFAAAFRGGLVEREQVLPERFLLLLCSDGILELMQQSLVEEKEAGLVAMASDLDLDLDQLISSLGTATRQDKLPDDVTLLLVRR